MDILKKLKELCDESAPCCLEDLGEEMNAYDASGGNFDDAYAVGFDHGENSAYKQVKEMIEQYEAQQAKDNDKG